MRGLGRHHLVRTALPAIVATTSLFVGAVEPVPAATPNAAPAVLGWSPGVPGDLPLRSPVTVYFNRPMATASVERAWSLTPPISGRFTATARSLTFTPAGSWRPGTSYRLTISSAARSRAGVPLAAPFGVRLATGGPLGVRSYSPSNGATGVPVNGLVAITFNHPMVPLAGLDLPASNPPGWHINISPAVAGHGSWLGTSTWVFHPDSALQPSTSYTVSLEGSVADAGGVRLGRALHWSFRTVTPQLFSRSPRNGASFADPRTPITVTFNQPMDHASAARFLELSAGGGPIAGSVTWRGTSMIFHPSAPLASGRRYEVRVGGRAESANRHARLGKTVGWHFRTAPLPRLDFTEPRSGGTVYGNWFDVYQRFGPVASPGGSGFSYQISIHFNAPMSKASLDRHLTVNPAVPRLQTYLYGPDQAGEWTYTVSGDYDPSTAYRVTITPGVLDTFGRPLSRAVTLPFETARITPSLALYGPPGAPGAISVSAGQIVPAPVQFMNVASATYTLIRTSFAALHAPQCCAPGQPPAGTLVRRWSAGVPHPLNRVQDVALSLAQKDGSPLKPGLYWLGVTAPWRTPGLPPGSQQPTSSETILVINTTITLKSGSNGTLAWVTSARTDGPLAAATVHLLDYQGRRIAGGVTNAHGVYFFHRQYPQLAGAMVADRVHFGLAQTYWNPTIDSPANTSYLYSWFWGGQYGSQANGAYLYTDRPVYRPGQRVHFRGVLWRDRDGVYSLLGPKTVVIGANDTNGRVLYRARVALDRYGAIHGSFLLPRTAATGSDFLFTNVPNVLGVNANFTVADYRKPEFLTAVTPARRSVVSGQKATVRVSVRYVFGAPVARQRVNWIAYGQPRLPQPPGWDGYQFVDWETLWQQIAGMQNGGAQSQFGMQVTHGAGMTDASGRLTIAVPADLAGSVLDRTLTVEATTTDASRESVSGRAQIVEHHARLAIGLAPEAQVVAAGQTARIDVVTVTGDGAAVPNQTLAAQIYRRTYTSRLNQATSGQSQWQAVPHDTLLLAKTVTTDAGGKGVVTFVADAGGEYRVVVAGKDQSGRNVQNAVTIDASAAGYSDWGTSNGTSLALKPDQSTYRVGETAHILVPAPFDRASALITVERGMIRRHWVQTLSSNSATVNVPVSLDDLPNVYVTVTLYRGWRSGSAPEWRYGVAELHVRIDPRHLIVHLSQNGVRHHPGDAVTYTVLTTDAAGHPVAAQLSLALVDTAVLALQDESNADILQALYPDLPLGVSTSSDATVSIDHLTDKPDFIVRSQGVIHGGAFAAAAPLKARAPSTGGGGDQAAGAFGQNAVTVRSHFADTAYWSGNLTTDSAGHAALRLRLPDNATTWRLDARGVTANADVGQAQIDTRATQDLVLRPVLPRFLVQGGVLRIGTVLNNTLHKAVSARVSVAATGVTVSGTRTVTVRIPAGGEQTIRWQADVLDGMSAAFTFRAAPSTSGVRGDAVRQTVPVHPPLTGETVATSGQVFDTVTQLIVLPHRAVSRPGALTVQLSPSLTAGAGAAFGQFRPSSYESNDDVANRVLAAGSLRTVPSTIAGLPLATYRRLPIIIASGVQKLLDHQLWDGGWPWFNDPYERSDPSISADAMQALAAAGQRGPLVRRALARGRIYLRATIGSVPAAQRPHVLLALAESGDAPVASARSLFANSIQRSHLDPAALADLGMTLALVHDGPASQTIASSLDGLAVVSATGAHWESNLVNPWSNSAIGATTNALADLLRVRPHDAFVPAAVRWLVLARSGSGWDSSRDSAQAIAVLTRFARAAREGTADYQYRVAVDGRAALSGHYGGSNQARARSARVPVSRLHRSAPNAVLIGRQAPGGTAGTGPLYYVARLQYFLPAAAIAPRSEGVSVERSYLDLRGRPIARSSAGSAFQVRLTIHTAQTLLYLNVRDPIPAGCEPIDASLRTSQQGLVRTPAWWMPFTGTQNLSWYLTHSDLRDDRVSLYISYLPPGTYRYTYLAHATVPGQYGVPPTHAAETFFPEVFGRSSGQMFTVTG